jgi:hypothetical protein
LIVPNLNIIITEIDLFLAGISRYIPLPPGLPVLLIRSTPLDKTTRRETIFAIAFLTFYPTGRADFNTARQRKINLNDYTYYIIYYYDRRFGQYSYWRFLVFNLFIRRKTSNSACFYISKALGLKDLIREKLIETL